MKSFIEHVKETEERRKMTWADWVATLSINPEAASISDIANMAAELTSVHASRPQEKIVGTITQIGACNVLETSDADEVIMTITTTVSEIKKSKRNLIYREVQITLINQPEPKP